MAQVMVPFANGKGGVGKTALACSYAVARAKQGADVIVTDLNDEQQTALAWSQVREHNGILPKVRVEVASARQALEMVGRCDVLVVDTPGWTDKSTLALAQEVDLHGDTDGSQSDLRARADGEAAAWTRAEGIEALAARRRAVAFQRGREAAARRRTVRAGVPGRGRLRGA